MYKLVFVQLIQGIMHKLIEEVDLATDNYPDNQVNPEVMENQAFTLIGTTLKDMQTRYFEFKEKQLSDPEIIKQLEDFMDEDDEPEGPIQ